MHRDDAPAISEACHTLARLRTGRRLMALYRRKLVAVICLLVLFKRRGWLGKGS